MDIRDEHSKDPRPSIRLTAPTFPKPPVPIDGHLHPSQVQSQPRQRPCRNREDSRHVQISEPDRPITPRGSQIYLGSYGGSSRGSRGSLRSQDGTRDASIGGSEAVSLRSSLSRLQLDQLLSSTDAEVDTYGLNELRDGFFDGSFHRSPRYDRTEMRIKAENSLPSSFFRSTHSSKQGRIVEQWYIFVDIFKRISTTRSGIKLAKSFLGFFITYVLCLIPAIRDWLGEYFYISALSAIVNHPGRSIGSQLDGAVLTSAGTVAGLLWGSLAVYVSTSTATASSGYGGIIAVFLIIFTFFLGWLRCVYIRFYQAVISAGLAIFYMCLTDTSNTAAWGRFSQYAIPWVVGQAICLVVCFVVCPAAGTRPLVISIHDTLTSVQAGLDLPHPFSPHLNKKLAWHYVDLSQAVRDFTIDVSFSPFSPHDVRSVRNLLQALLRAVLAIRPETVLFDQPWHSNSPADSDAGITFRAANFKLSDSLTTPLDACKLVCETLAEPTKDLLNALISAISSADAVFMDISGYWIHLGPSRNVTSNLTESLSLLHQRVEKLDEADDSLFGNPDVLASCANDPRIVELFLFVHPVRQATEKMQALLEKILEMQREKKKWRVRLPSYPFMKALSRSNAQVRHDRGGLNAGFYFRTKAQLDKTIHALQSRNFVPLIRDYGDANVHHLTESNPTSTSSVGTTRLTKFEELTHQAWTITHRLQGFESRFAVKVTILIILFSIPAWLQQSRGWWEINDSWWVVATIWIMMHPRVGGTFLDLAVRTSCVALGSVWGALAYAAGNGNPIVVGVFAAIYMIPMLYRFTQSSHPRSGIMGCISFTVISLSEYSLQGKPSITTIAWTRGVAFSIGIVSAIVVNWFLWPFVARHELRKSISAMIIHSSILYRSVVSKYIYYNEGHKPRPEDITRSEMLEGRLREGFVRIRQLMELTRHEMRLRAPFDPLPYSALIAVSERFFERLVDIRQSSLYFEPYMLASYDETKDSLLAVRRDAVATVLMNLYVLAGALRSGRPLPRYLPSAATARRRLLDKMEHIEAERAAEGKKAMMGKGRRWADVYHYAYSSALTDVVEQLQELQYYTREIVGEVGFDGLA